MTTTPENPLVSEQLDMEHDDDAVAALQLYELGLRGGRRPNAVKLASTLQSLQATHIELYHSMFYFAYETAGHDLDNPLDGDLLTRFRRNLTGWCRVSPTIPAEMKSVLDETIKETERFQSLLNDASTDQLALYNDALKNAYWEGCLDKPTPAEIVVSTAALALTDVSCFVNPDDQWVVEGDFGYLTSCKTQAEAMNHAQQEVEEQKRLRGLAISITLNA